MATSPIYGWLEPDNTDLVKNGALAIRTLGNAIDTTMATMTPKSIVDAKGDLIAATANDTPARLAVGANGETLVADSSTSTGLRYTAGTVQANPFINSAFQVWQRGTSASFGSAGVVTSADRWATYSGNLNTTLSRQVTGDTTNLPFIQYCARMQRNSGQTATNLLEMGQSLETINSIPYAGKTVTLSFYARAGANYSATSNAFSAFIRTGTGTDQSYVAGAYTGLATPLSLTATLTTTWQRFTVTGIIASTATELAANFSWTPTGTAGAADFAEVTGVQLDVGSVALPFRTYAGTIHGELAACQRYYQKSFPQTTAPASNTGRTGAIENYAILAAGAFALSFVRLSVNMRTAPTVTVYNPSAANNQARNNTLASDCSGTTVEGQTDNSFRYYYLLPTSTVSTNVITSHYEATAEL